MKLRTLIRRLIPILALACMVVPLLAQDAPPAEEKWQHGDDEIILDGKLVKDSVTKQWGADVTVAMAHYVTDQTEIGPIVSYAKDPVTSTDGAGLGAIYQWNLPDMRFGNFFLGGDAQYLLMDAGDLAPILAAGRFGYRLHVGDSAAIRVSIDLRRPVSPDGEQAQDELSSVGLAFGVSFGVTPYTAVY